MFFFCFFFTVLKLLSSIFQTECRNVRSVWLVYERCQGRQAAALGTIGMREKEGSVGGGSGGGSGDAGRDS